MSAPTVSVPRQRTTRKPTGLPSWPILLLAGVPKAGKSYGAAMATASDLIGHTYWITVGENDPDEYGLIPGANFEIVDHDGSLRDIVSAVRWASAQPRVDGKPTMIVVDSVSRVWELLSAAAQAEANSRRDRKSGKSAPVDDEAVIHPDLWNRAADRWGDLVDALRDHDGPVIMTALMDEITVFENDRPTKNKTWKITGHKTLPGVATAIVEMPSRGMAWVSGVVSYRMQIPERRRFPDFTVDALWREMGLADTQVGERHRGRVDVQSSREAVSGEPRGGRQQPAQQRGQAREHPMAEQVRAVLGQALGAHTEAELPDVPEALGTLVVGALLSQATRDLLGLGDGKSIITVAAVVDATRKYIQSGDGQSVMEVVKAGRGAAA